MAGRLPRGIKKRFGSYYGRWTDANGYERQKALSQDLETAIRILNKLRADVDLERAGLGAMVHQSTPLQDLVGPYIADLKTRVSAKHLRNTRDSLLEFVERIGPGRQVSSIKLDHVLGARATIVAGGSSNRTANIKANAFRALLRWSELVGLIAINPVPTLPQLPECGKATTRRRHRLTREECAALLGAAQALDDKYGGIPQAPFFRFLLGSGLRYSEACALTWSDIRSDRDGASVVVRDEVAKWGRSRTVPLPEDIGRELARGRAAQGQKIGRLPGPSDRVFLGRRGSPVSSTSTGSTHARFLVKCIEAAPDVLCKTYPDGTTIDIHALRHTYATSLGESGADLKTIMYLLGHSTPAMSMRYIDLARGDKRQAVDAMGDLSGRQEDHRGDRADEDAG